MKILSKDRCAVEHLEYVDIIPESSDDIYTLYNILEYDDLVEAVTCRKVEVTKKLKEKRTFKLKIAVESLDVDLQASFLFVKGTILSETKYITPGSSHTLEITLYQKIRIFKSKWTELSYNSLKNVTENEDILVMLIKKKEFLFYEVTRNFVKYITTIEHKNNNFKPVFTYITPGLLNKYKMIILASFYDSKKEFYRELYKKKDFQRFQKRTAIIDLDSEAVGRKTVDTILTDPYFNNNLMGVRFLEEMNILFEFFKLHSGSEMTVVGYDEVQESISSVALKYLLITNVRFKSFDIEERRKIEELCKIARGQKIKICIIPVKHNIGEDFEKMGGIGGILKFQYK